MNFNKNRHAVFRLQYHLILVTKYRYKAIDPAINRRLKVIAHNIFKEFKDKIDKYYKKPFFWSPSYCIL